MKIQENLWRHSGIASAAIRPSHSGGKVHPSASGQMIDISVSQSNASDSVFIKRTSRLWSQISSAPVYKRKGAYRNQARSQDFFSGEGGLDHLKKKHLFSLFFGKTSPFPSKFRGGGGGAGPLAKGQIETLHRGSVLLRQMRCSVSPWRLSFFGPQIDSVVQNTVKNWKFTEMLLSSYRSVLYNIGFQRLPLLHRDMYTKSRFFFFLSATNRTPWRKHWIVIAHRETVYEAYAKRRGTLVRSHINACRTTSDAFQY